MDKMSLEQAIQAIKAGDRETGRREIAQILAEDTGSVTAWIWLSACYDDPVQRKQCLQSALQADPENEIARCGLQYLESVESDRAVPVSSTPAKTSTSKSSSKTPVPEGKHTVQENQQIENLAWFCPDCRSRNLTPAVPRVRTRLQCPSCGREYDCVNGEAVWGQRDIGRAIWSQWLDWIVRLQQADGSVVEVGFALHTPHFTIAGGDFLVILIKQTWSGQTKVVQIDNKTTGNVIRPGKPV